MWTARRWWVGIGLPVLFGACTPSVPGGQAPQGRCDHDASVWFQAQHPDGVTRETVDSAIRTEQYAFSDHFNSHLQHCFVITSEDKSTVYPDRPSAGTSAMALLDLDTHAELGRMVKPWPAAPGGLRICSVGAKRCASTREWEELAAPYMER